MPCSNLLGRPRTSSHRRRLRECARQSGGRIGSGQGGYKLVRQMTKEEFDHYCAWMRSQAGEMERRIVESQKVFFSVSSQNSVLKNV